MSQCRFGMAIVDVIQVEIIRNLTQLQAIGHDYDRLLSSLGDACAHYQRGWIECCVSASAYGSACASAKRQYRDTVCGRKRSTDRLRTIANKKGRSRDLVTNDCIFSATTAQASYTRDQTS